MGRLAHSWVADNQHGVGRARQPPSPRRTGASDDKTAVSPFAGLPPSRVPVSQPDDTSEKLADTAADVIVPGPSGGRVARRSPVSYAPGEVWDALREESRPLASHERRGGVGIDLSAVRVHTGGRALASTRALAASAYTIGNHIVLGGDYDPHGLSGSRLMAHELAHVAQHENSTHPLVVSRQGAAPTTEHDQRRLPIAPGPASTVLGAGLEKLADEAALLRTLYHQGEEQLVRQVEVLRAAGISPQEISEFSFEMRNLLKEEVRDKGPKLFKRIAELRNVVKYRSTLSKSYEELLKTKTVEQITESALRKTSKFFNRMPAVLGHLSKAAVVLPVGITVWRVATASDEDRPRVQGEEIGGHSGSLLGIGACLALGVASDGIGFAVCDLVGFTAGSAIGGEIGGGAPPSSALPQKRFTPELQQSIAAELTEALERVKPLAESYDFGASPSYTGAADPAVPLQSALAELRDSLRFAQKNDVLNLMLSLTAARDDLETDSERVSFGDRQIDQELERVEKLQEAVATLAEFADIR